MQETQFADGESPPLVDNMASMEPVDMNGDAGPLPASAAETVEKMIPGMAGSRIEIAMKLKNDHMREGHHYHTLSFTNKKTGEVTTRTSLGKPGADLLRQEFNLGIRFKHSREPEGNHIMCFCDSVVYHIPTGREWGGGSGCACTDEKVLKSLGLTLNVAIKMAEKRAGVGGTINAIGLSEILTGDLEDWDDRDLQAHGMGRVIVGQAVPVQLQASQQPVQAVQPVQSGHPQSYAEWITYQDAQMQESLHQAEMSFRQQFDACMSEADLNNVGANLAQGGFPEVFCAHMRSFYGIRLNQIRGTQNV